MVTALVSALTEHSDPPKAGHDWRNHSQAVMFCPFGGIKEKVLAAPPRQKIEELDYYPFRMRKNGSRRYSAGGF